MQVCVWSTASDAPRPCPGEAAACLSAAERVRASAFRFARDRYRFTLARGFLRYVLGQHLVIEPAAVRLLEAPGKKPWVIGQDIVEGLRFSLSRSADKILVAVTRGREVGVDLECARPSIDIESFAPSVFSLPTLNRWKALDPSQRSDVLYRAWSRKEALGKGEGHGISAGPETIEVPLLGLPPGHCHRVDSPNSVARWLMSDLPSDPGAFGCLVVERGGSDAVTTRYVDQRVDGEWSGFGNGPRLGVPDCAQLIVRTFMAVADDPG